jgi:hypothetical protein
MSEVLLETIIEKLESLETLLLKESNVSKDNSAQLALLKEVSLLKSKFILLVDQLKANEEKMTALMKEMSALSFKLSTPLENNIRHYHHFHKGLLVAVAFFVLSACFLYGWITCSNAKEQFEANDMKYRFLKMNGNTSLLKLTHDTDSSYFANKNDFARKVVQAEERLAEQAEMLRLAGEKEKEARELMQRAGKSLSK